MRIRVIYTAYPSLIGDKCAYLSEEQADADLNHIDGIRPMSEMLAPGAVNSAFDFDYVDTENDDPTEDQWGDLIDSVLHGTTPESEFPKELIEWCKRGEDEYK